MKNTPLRDIFFPRRCCGCDRLTGNTSPFCEDCEKLVIKPAANTGRCKVCGLHLSQCLCGKRIYYSALSAVFYHEGKPRKNIFRLKYHVRPDLADAYSRAIILQLEERDILGRTDIITFIPMRPYAQLLRGYNQSELIAKRLSLHTEIPCLPILKKEFSTGNQHKLGQVARSGNLLGVFEPREKYTSDIKGKRILIIDDVFTTGNTLNEAAKTLLIFGAEEIFSAVCNAKKLKKNIEEKKKMC